MVKKLLLLIILTFSLFGIINSGFAATNNTSVQTVEDLEQKVKDSQIIADQAKSNASVATNIEKLQKAEKEAKAAKIAADLAEKSANKIAEEAAQKSANKIAEEAAQKAKGSFVSKAANEAIAVKAAETAKVKAKAAADATVKETSAIEALKKAREDIQKQKESAIKASTEAKKIEATKKTEAAQAKAKAIEAKNAVDNAPTSTDQERAEAIILKDKLKAAEQNVTKKNDELEKAKNASIDATTQEALATEAVKVLSEGKSAESYKNEAKVAEANVNIPKTEIDILNKTEALNKAKEAALEKNIDYPEGASEAEKTAKRKALNDTVNVKQKELNVSEQQKKIAEAELNLAKINGDPNATPNDIRAAEDALADNKKTLENLEVQRDAAKALAGKSAKSQHDLECEGSKAGSCIDKPNFVINVDDISPGMKVEGKGDSVQEVINYTLGTIIQKLMIGLGSIALFIMTVGGGYMILYHGQDELLSKGKSIFISGITALVVALGSYYLVDLLRDILYAVN